MERVIPLAGESGGPRIRVHPRFRRRGWSVYGAQRSQPVATGGKCASPENGSNKPKPLPPVATSCRSERLVRRGVIGSSPSEGSAKSRKSPGLCSGRLAEAAECGGFGAVYGAFKFQTPRCGVRGCELQADEPTRAIVDALMCSHEPDAADGLLVPLHVGDRLPWKLDRHGESLHRRER
jgi:hypothetical protein